MDDLPTAALSARSALLSSDTQDRRSRVVVASAENAVQSGYAASTVTAIMARAGLRNAAFYDHFADKRQAFQALHELAFQQTMDVGAAAYFSAKQWPDRVWSCLLSIGQLHAAHPAIAHIGLVETHVLGQPAVQRVEEARHAFATLLRADSRNTSAVPSVTGAEAIGAAILEIAHDRVRDQGTKDLPRHAYRATYLALAPFIGVQAADRFVQPKLADAERGERV